MTFAGVIAYLAKLYAAVLALTGLIQPLQQLLGQGPVVYSTVDLYQQAEIDTANIFNAGDGLVAIYTECLAIATDVTDARVAILAAIAAITGGSGPVTLPTIPPPGYGGQSLADIATAVWGNIQNGDLASPYQYVQAGGRSNISLGGTTGYRPDGGLFAYYYTGLDTAGVHPSFYPAGNFPDILPTDNLLTWLARVNPAADCLWWAGPGSWVEIIGNNGDGTAQFLTVIDDSQFQAIKESLGLVTRSAGLPLWPGLAGVILGTPVAIAPMLTITTPLNGVIVELTAEPSKSSFYSFDGVNSYRNLGALSFTTDDGQQEPSQSLGFTSAIYTPKSMVIAAGLKWRSVGGVAGTVTPWVIA